MVFENLNTQGKAMVAIQTRGVSRSRGETEDQAMSTTTTNQHYGGHVADGSSIQSHSAGLLYPYVIQMQEMTSGDFAGMWCATILPGEPAGAWYSVRHNTAYDAAQNHILNVLKAPKG